MRDTFTQVLRLGLAIVALALVLYWVDSAFLRDKRLPACVQEKLPPDRVCLDSVFLRWGGKVVWIDARSESDFELSHLLLQEKRMFPIRSGEFDKLFDEALDRLQQAAERGEPVVVFCTGACTAAEEIARRIKESDLVEAPIYVLEGGWDAIKRDGRLRY